MYGIFCYYLSLVCSVTMVFIIVGVILFIEYELFVLEVPVIDRTRF